MSPARLRPSALLASLLLAQWAAVGTARADPVFYTTLGNALNPSPINPSTGGRWMDVEGLGTRIPDARTPTGLLYNIPLDPGDEPEVKKPDNEWKTSGFIDWGGIYIGGNDRNAGFRNYKDLKTGPYVENFGVLSEKRDDARFFEAVGGGVGMHDQFYSLQFGRYNDWRVTTFYSETPQVFTTTYRSLWNGVGSGNLSLVNLAPGGTASPAATQTNILNALAATDDSLLEVVRKKAGKVVLTSTNEISSDGKTMTITTKGVNASGQPVHNVRVYDKR